MGLLRRRGKDDDLDNDPFSGNSDLNGNTTPGSESFGNNPQQNNDLFGEQQQVANTQNNFPAQTLPPHIDTNNPDFNAQMGIERPEQMSVPQDFFTQGHKEQQTNMQNVGQQMGTQGGDTHVEKDLQIIIAKLDALKSELDSIHQRVQKIEKIADTDQQAAIQQQRQQAYRRW